jgi:hypothetical protein
MGRASESAAWWSAACLIFTCSALSGMCGTSRVETARTDPWAVPGNGDLSAKRCCEEIRASTGMPPLLGRTMD